MRAVILGLAVLALTGCHGASGRVAFATPIPEARITAPADLEGNHGVAGIGGVEFTSLPKAYTVSITQDRIAVRGDCVSAGWSYRFEGATLVTKPIDGPTCRRVPTPEEKGLAAAFTGADKVSRTPIGGIIFEGTGGTVTLFQ